MKILAVLILSALAFVAGCANFPVRGDNQTFSRPYEDQFESFYDRHLGDNLLSDALNGFIPTAILGLVGDAIDNQLAKEK